MKIKYSDKDFKSFYKKDKHAKSYDIKRSSTLKKRIVRSLERYTATLFLRKDSKIIEVGVGTGFITERIIKYGTVFGIDTSNVMVQELKNKITNNSLSLKNMSLYDKLPSKKFDYAISYRVLMHLNENNIIKGLNNLEKSLKDSGLVVVDIPRKSLFKDLVQFLKKIFVPGEEEHNYTYNESQIYRMVNKTENLKIKTLLAIDHVWLFLPLYLVFNSFKDNDYLKRLILMIERKLIYFYSFSTRWIVICEKQ